MFNLPWGFESLSRHQSSRTTWASGRLAPGARMRRVPFRVSGVPVPPASCSARPAAPGAPVAAERVKVVVGRPSGA